MLFPQQGNLTVHFRFHKEIYDNLPVLLHKFFKLFFIGSLNSHYHLGRCINITREFELGLGINILDINNNNITEYLQHTVKVCRIYIRNTKRAFRLRQSGYVCIQYIKQSTSCRTIPHCFIHYNQYLISSTAGRRGKQVLLSLLARSQYQNHQHQTQIKCYSFHNSMVLLFSLL